MLTSTCSVKQKLTKQDDSVIIYLLNLNSGNTSICGLSMTGWVKKAVDSLPYIELNYGNSNLIEFLKPKLVNSKYSIVLFSNTPLITTPSILKIIEYVLVKKINACKFNGGFAFNNEYLKSAKDVKFDSFLPLDDQEFMVVNNQKSIMQATFILQQRIIQKHIANGVQIMQNCQIDEGVEIGKDSMVFSGNVIKGDTVIGNNTILKENNIIENCVIGDDVCVANSNLNNSKIENNVFILPFCYINNATIRKNCYISSGVTIEKRTVRAGSKVQKE